MRAVSILSLNDYLQSQSIRKARQVHCRSTGAQSLALSAGSSMQLASCRYRHVKTVCAKELPGEGGWCMHASTCAVRGAESTHSLPVKARAPPNGTARANKMLAVNDSQYMSPKYMHQAQAPNQSHATGLRGLLCLGLLVRYIRARILGIPYH